MRTCGWRLVHALNVSKQRACVTDNRLWYLCHHFHGSRQVMVTTQMVAFLTSADKFTVQDKPKILREHWAVYLFLTLSCSFIRWQLLAAHLLILVSPAWPFPNSHVWGWAQHGWAMSSPSSVWRLHFHASWPLIQHDGFSHETTPIAIKKPTTSSARWLTSAFFMWGPAVAMVPEPPFACEQLRQPSEVLRTHNRKMLDIRLNRFSLLPSRYREGRGDAQTQHAGAEQPIFPQWHPTPPHFKKKKTKRQKKKSAKTW